MAVPQSPPPRAKVAVITRTRHRERLLRRALLSVAHQTHCDYVHIVVNDGGDPQAVEEALGVLPPDRSGRVHVLHNEKCRGMESAANAGIAACESEFIVIHDDDDSWHRRFMEKAINAIGNNKGVVTHSYVVLEEMRPDGIHILSRKRHCPRQITLFKMAMENFQFPNLSFLYRRDAYHAVGAYDEALSVMGDWDFNMRFLSKFDIELVPELLANYHKRVGGETADSNSVDYAQADLWRIRSMLANRLLRDDLKDGRLGLGLLVNLGLEIKELQDRLALLHFFNPAMMKMLETLRRLFRSSAERRALRELGEQWQDCLACRPQRTNSSNIDANIPE